MRLATALLALALVAASPLPLPAVPVDINTASVEQLVSLPGIGPVLASRIIETRAKLEGGRFATVEDLTKVPGIKAKRLESLRPFVTVGK